MPEQLNIVTWDTPPDFDKWGWDDYWGCVEWQNWFTALKQHFGAEAAQNVWNYAWDKQTTAAHALDCRWNSVFRDFAEKEGLDFDSPITSVAFKVGDVLGAAVTTVQTTIQILQWLIPIILILLILGLVYVGYRAISQNKLPFGIQV